MRAAFAGHLEGARVPARGPDRAPPRSGVDAGVVGAAVLARDGAASVRPRSRSASRCRRSATTSEPALAVAAAAEAAGLDGVFAYDHLFRRDRDGRRRPALEMFALMGAVAAATDARSRSAPSSRARRCARTRRWRTASTRWRASLGPERLLVAIGAGDDESREENETFGLDVRHGDRARRPRCATRSTRRATAATRCGSAAATPRCARSRPPTPTAGTAGAPGVERFRDAGRQPARRPRPARRSRCRGVVSSSSVTTTRAARSRRSGSARATDVLVGGPDDGGRRAPACYVDAGAEWLMLGPDRLLGSRQRDDPRGTEMHCPALTADGRESRPTACQERAAALVPSWGWSSAGSTRCRRTSSAIMDALKIEARRAGEDVIDLGFGNPDLPSPDIAVEEAGRGGARTRATTATRRAGASRSCAWPIADLYQRKFGVDARPRDAGVLHHRRQGGLLAPDVGAARPGRRRAGARARRTRSTSGARSSPAPRCATCGSGPSRTSSPTCSRRGRTRGRGRASSCCRSRTTRPPRASTSSS